MKNNECNLNANVATILDDYIAKTKTKFAVLINGGWGCGKTFFIRRYIENLGGTANGAVNSEIGKHISNVAPFFCHVSLFDITNKKEIDAAIMAKANPLLTNEKAKALGRFGAWAIDKIPMVPSGAGAIFNNVSGVLAKFIKTFPKNLVIILDDVERSKLQIQEILGYMSSLLEENNAKVILICNEKEIINSDNKEIYNKFKEKVIGITQTIIPDPATILSTNIDAVSNRSLKMALSDAKSHLLDIVSQFGFTNLRSLEVFVFEAELIVASLDNEVLQDKASIQKILQNLFILSYATKNGEISPQEIATCKNTYFLNCFRKSVESQSDINDSKEIRFYEKYNKYISLSDDDLNNFWITFFILGIISDKLNAYYRERLAATQESMPAPLRLWGLYDLSAEEFEKHKEIMLSDIQNRKYTDIRMILHAFGILLYISESKIYTFSKDVILNMAKSYIVNNNKLQIPQNYSAHTFEAESGYGKCYLSRETEEFKEIQEIVNGELKKLLKKIRTSESKDFLQLDTNAFLEKISSPEMQNDDFILHHIDCCEFFQKLSQPKKEMIFLMPVRQGPNVFKGASNLTISLHGSRACVNVSSK